MELKTLVGSLWCVIELDRIFRNRDRTAFQEFLLFGVGVGRISAIATILEDGIRNRVGLLRVY